MSAAEPLEVVAPEVGSGAVGHLSFAGAPDSLYARLVKPACDRVVALVLVLVTLPLTAAVALAVRISMGSPVLFRQPRVGRGGVPFTVLKFRTMRPDRRARARPVVEDRRVTHKSERDPRHTSVGRVLRAWSLDELPQLWNVVRGDMSLIGPRPELVEVVERYAPWQHQRHLVRPGITGLWQVSRRGDGLMHLHTDVDLEYVAGLSARHDLGILVRTLPAALARRGA
jgi:lipopolysaccharide/colanic/teichoic acid biosynthesis glycosyltransferase